MEVKTIRFPEGMAEDLQSEAEEEDLSLSEYVRSILRERDRIRQENTDEYDKRIRDLEERVDDLEEDNQGDGAAPIEEPPQPEPEPETVEMEIPGSGETQRAREDAIYQMRDRLRELGRANKDDLLEVVDPDDVRYASIDSFWSNCVKGKDTLRVFPGVEPPPEGNRTWRWVSENEW